MERYSTVPTADAASIGVKRKKFLGETVVTSNLLASISFRRACAAQPVPSTTTFRRDGQWGLGERLQVEGNAHTYDRGNISRAVALTFDVTYMCWLVVCGLQVVILYMGSRLYIYTCAC